MALVGHLPLRIGPWGHSLTSEYGSRWWPTIHSAVVATSVRDLSPMEVIEQVLLVEQFAVDAIPVPDPVQ